MKVLRKFRKLFILLTLAAAVGAFWLFDFAWSKQYEIRVVDMPAQTVMGDSVVIKVRVEKNGKAQAGHSLAALVVEGQGSFYAYRQETDESGEAEFTYFTLKESKYNPVQDITVRILDESNSVFLEVNADIDIVIHMVSAKGGNS